MTVLICPAKSCCDWRIKFPVGVEEPDRKWVMALIREPVPVVEPEIGLFVIREINPESVELPDIECLVCRIKEPLEVVDPNIVLATALISDPASVAEPDIGLEMER
jgi:hypothetical protein